MTRVPSSSLGERGPISLRALLALVALTLACGKCGKPAVTPVVADPVERVLPGTAVGVLVVPSLSQLGKKLAILEGLKIAAFLAPLQGFENAHAFTSSLVDQLGIDLRDEAAMANAGIDSSRALGVALLVSGQTVLAIPVKDAGKLHLALEKLSSNRLGAAVVAEQKTGEVTVKSFTPAQGQPAKLGYVLAHGYALVATDDGIAKLAQLGAMAEPQSLQSDAAYKATLARNTEHGDLFAYAPVDSPVLASVPLKSAFASASLTPSAFTVTLDAPWKGDAETLAFLTPQPGADLVNGLPKDAFAIARYSGDPAQLAPMVTTILGPYLAKAFTDAGFDVKKQILEALKPGVVASLSLAPRPPIARGMPELDLRKTNPFTYAHLAGIAEAKQASGLVETLTQVSAIAPKFGAKIERKERNGAPVFVTTYAQGEGVHFGVKDARVMFGSPMPRLDEVMNAPTSTEAPVKGLGTEAFSAVVDLQKLSQSVRALPADAWGLGGFAMKATTVRWLDATDDLHGITVSAGAKDGFVRGTVSLSLGTQAELRK